MSSSELFWTNGSFHLSHRFPDCAHMKSTIVCLNGSTLRPPAAPPHTPLLRTLQLKAQDLTFVWTMPALWSLKCSRVAAISISLAPATHRKLELVQSGLSNPAHICQSLFMLRSLWNSAAIENYYIHPSKDLDLSHRWAPDKICTRMYLGLDKCIIMLSGTILGQSNTTK